MSFVQMIAKTRNLFSIIREQLREQGAADIPILVGGLVPIDDIAALKAMGVVAVFTAGTPIADIAAFITSHVGSAPPA